MEVRIKICNVAQAPKGGEGAVNNIFDAVMAVLFVLGALVGLRIGLIRGVARIVSYILALWVGAAWSKNLSGVIDARFGIREWVLKHMGTGSGISIPVGANRAAESIMMDQVSRSFDSYGFPPAYKELVMKQVEAQITQAGSAVNITPNDLIAGLFSDFILQSISFFIIFAAVQFGAEFLGRLIQATIGKLPLIWGVDRLGGAALGFVQQFLFLSTAVGLLYPMIRFLPANLHQVIQGSTIMPWMMSFFNLLTGLVIRMPIGGVGTP